jgi:pyruvate dehydrogenase E1 component alpha subunit
MHLVDLAAGLPGSSSITGGTVPMAVGLALSRVLLDRPGISVSFFGDGAADEGVVYESVNFAMLKKLPVIFVLENNQFSMCSPPSARQAIDSVYHHLDHPALKSAKIDGNDVEAVLSVARNAADRARAGQGPSFIECVTYRLRGHAGSGSDSGLGYRSRDEIDEWGRKCPVTRSAASLRGCGRLSLDEEKEMEARIKAEIDDAFAFAQKSPLPGPQDLSTDLFAE